MVVFTESAVIINNFDITTDVGRTVAEITGNFTIKLKENQSISDDILSVAVSRIGGFDPFSQSFFEVFVNGTKLDKINWPFGRTEPIVLELEDIQDLLFTDGRTNKIKVKVAQSALDGLNEWGIYAVYTYNLNTLDPPDDPIIVLPPDVDEGQDECGPLDIECKLFGDTKKTVTTIALLVGVGVTVYGATQAVRLVRG